MNRPPLLYLAGPIAGCNYAGATDWREYVQEQLRPYGILVISPMRAKEFLSEETSIGDRPYSHALVTASGITQRDRFDVKRCDAVLANFIGATKISAGTMIEFGWADAFRKPVIIAMEPGNVHDHPIVNTIAGFVLPTLDEAIAIARHVLAIGT